MSKEGMTQTVLATTLSEAIQKDEDGDGHDMDAGLFGVHTSQWIRDIEEQLNNPSDNSE